MKEPEDIGLVGDVGGTHVRLAVARRVGASVQLERLESILHGGRVDLPGSIRTYLAHKGAPAPAWAVIAVAGPVTDGRVALTNAEGEASEASLSCALGGGAARLINDFAALALSVPLLQARDLHPLGPVQLGRGEGSVAVIGPGTGLGVSALVRDGARWAVAAGEGGHVGFAPTDEVEVEVWRRITAQHGRCSLERLICGPGLLALHGALGAQTSFDSPAALVAAAESGGGEAQRTVERFCRLLGAAVGDAALMFGASGGVLLGGGIAPRLIPWLERGDFRGAFEAKGRLTGFMRPIFTAVITNPHAALLGAASAAPTHSA